jgi:gliding motility-associated-like protein
MYLFSFARHIRGGEVSYTYLGPGAGANAFRYKITVRLYIDCGQTDPGQRPPAIPLTIFTGGRNNQQFGNVLSAPKISEERIAYDPNSNPCINNPPTDICYDRFIYEVDVELPDNPNGYIVSYQRCCRINNIENIINSGNTGGTYLCEIPGTNTLPPTEHNSSPFITGSDAVAICANATFTFDFSATDADGDSLSYSLCDAYGGASSMSPAPNVAAPPPYIPLAYKAPYTGAFPFGPGVSINPNTGIISGIAPRIATGISNNQYVVTVCINEYRRGKLINVHRKDIHLKVSDCVPLKAVLQPDYSYCDDFLVTFKNEQPNPAGTIFIWQFGDNTKPDTSLDAVGSIQHQYLIAGTYIVKLKVILAGQCTDSTTARANVYPGFFPGFVVDGSCLFTNFVFRDTSITRYGIVNKWRWDFGDQTTLADTSRIKTPTWKYSSLGIKNVQLIVESSVGCRDTILKDVEVKDRPKIGVAFRDTLICSSGPIQDTLQLSASGLGIFSWTPNTRIINENTPNPLVFPTTTTVYRVLLNENGCTNTDSVRVRVVDRVTIDAGPDTTICLTDAVRLNPSGDALAFEWSPTATLNNPTIKNPIATPVSNFITYSVIGRIGKCDASSSVDIRAVPYPGAKAGPDATICFEDTTQLNASIVGNRFNWFPPAGLSNDKILNPLAFPRRTTRYILQVFDVLGCPKPGLDTVIVTVRPLIIADAGRDTNVVVNQRLQLRATGAEFFTWSPPNFLSSTTIANPTAIFPAPGIYKYSVRAYTPEDCFGIDSITIKVFDTNPDIFVPNAFNPQKGGANAMFRPILVGISKLDLFRVYNRWGQLLYSSNDYLRGWDGTYGGKLQAPDTYVWIVQASDFTGKRIFKKGTVMLVR